MLLFGEFTKEISISSLYDCGNCSTKERYERGCKRNKRKSVFETPCICEGAIKCSICGGVKLDNTIRVHRCPRAILKDTQISRVVQYFYHYIVSDYTLYPDGKGLFYQPKKLKDAFDILLMVYIREEKEKRKRDK